MPWDHFCANCGSTLEGGMADGDEMDREMKAFDDRMQGKLMKCGECGTVYDFDSFEILNEDEIKKSAKEILELNG